MLLVGNSRPESMTLPPSTRRAILRSHAEGYRPESIARRYPRATLEEVRSVIREHKAAKERARRRRVRCGLTRSER